MKKYSEEKIKKLLNILQEDFPLVSEPFKFVAKKTGLAEEEVIDILKELKEKGIIRHFGASINSHKLGYITCLCATSIPENKEEIAYKIAELPEITHAYLREHRLNFWFTTVTKSQKELEELCKKLEKTFKIKIKKFPTLKKFKVKAVFEV